VVDGRPVHGARGEARDTVLTGGRPRSTRPRSADRLGTVQSRSAGIPGLDGDGPASGSGVGELPELDAAAFGERAPGEDHDRLLEGRIPVQGPAGLSPGRLGTSEAAGVTTARHLGSGHGPARPHHVEPAEADHPSRTEAVSAQHLTLGRPGDGPQPKRLWDPISVRGRSGPSGGRIDRRGTGHRRSAAPAAGAAGGPWRHRLTGAWATRARPLSHRQGRGHRNPDRSAGALGSKSVITHRR
jgi:hypothetical protein